MRIIFLNRFFWPDFSATSQMLSDIAFGLHEARETAEIIVITSRLAYDDASRRFAPEEVHSGVRIVRVWTSRFGRRHLVGRAFDYATFYLSSAWTLARLARRGDIVVIKTDPPLLAVVAHPVARLKGARVVNWLQDIYPEVAQVLGLLPGPLRLLAGPLRWMRDASLRRADANVVLGSRMAARVRAIAGGHPAIVEIPNFADGAVIRPLAAAESELRRAWGLDGAFVVAYSGNLGRAHDVATLLDAMEHLEAQGRRERPIIWLFIGGGAHVRALADAAAARGIERLRFQPYQPKARLAESLSVADVHLVSLTPALEGLIVPSKLYGIMAAGRPALFIGDADGEVACVLARGDCGVTVPIGDGQKLADTIVALSRDPAALARMGRNARAVFDAEFDRPIAVRRWLALLDGPMNRP